MGRVLFELFFGKFIDMGKGFDNFFEDINSLQKKKKKKNRSSLGEDKANEKK